MPANPSIRRASSSLAVVLAALVALAAGWAVGIARSRSVPPPEPADGLWQLVVHGDAQAHRARVANQPQLLRVEIDRSGSQGAWQIQLVRENLPLARGTTYAVRFRARAEQPKTITVALTQNRPPWATRGLYQPFQLTPQWQDMAAEFSATDDDPRARMYVELGADDAAVDFEGLALWQGDRQVESAAAPQTEDATPGQSWKLLTRAGEQAALEPAHSPGDATRVHVHSTSTDPWCIAAVHTGPPLEAGGRYVLHLRARAPRARTLACRVTIGGGSLRSAGLDETIQLEPTWQAVHLPFTARVTVPQSATALGAGAHAGEVEFTGVAIRRAREETAAKNRPKLLGSPSAGQQ